MIVSMPLALVLSAGGMFGAWQAGVWKALAPEVKPDLIVGASAGAWNAWAIAGGCPVEELVAEWMDPRTARLMEPGLSRTGLLNPAALHEKARELAARYRPRLPFALTLVELPRLELRMVRGEEVTWQHLAAACSIPFGFPPVTIDGKRYVDGGFRGALPLWAACELGATSAIAVNALTALPFRLVRKVIRPRRPSRPMDVLHIEPSRRLGSLKEAVVWSRSRVEQWVELGEKDGEKARARHDSWARTSNEPQMNADERR